MISKAVTVGRGNVGSAIGTLFPQKPMHKITLGTVIVCLVSLVICITLITHAQSNQVLLLANALAAAPVQAVPVAQMTPGVSSGANASRALVRINQAAVNQYASQAEHDTWWPSTCSTASMTEVMNSYGHHFKITNVLQVESRIGAIAADSGLLDPSGIDLTAGRLGFETHTLNSPSLDQVIDIANAGEPVIVNFPPATWSGGHLLVVRGGTDTTVDLADSSTLNHGAGLQEVSRAYFLTYWRGFAKVLTPSRYVMASKPTVSADQINGVLAHHNSTAAGLGQTVYDLAVKYGIDDAYVLVTFGHESSFGTAGEARSSLSPGNLRCVGQGFEDLRPTCRDDYAWFPTWKEGFEALYRLLAGSLYAGDGRIIPELIIPRFAPQADNNDEAGYIAALKGGIDAMRAGKLDLPK